MINVYIFFGPPGSGKSYLGKKFAELHGFTFYEADNDYLPEYRERVKLSEQDKQKVYEEFYSVVISKINKLLINGKPVVVASALGKNINRRRFIDQFKEEVLFILIRSDVDLLIDNALKREFPELEGSKLTPEKEESLKNHLLSKISSFEEPDFSYIKIDNDYTDKTLNSLASIVVN